MEDRLYRYVNEDRDGFAVILYIEMARPAELAGLIDCQLLMNEAMKILRTDSQAKYVTPV